MARTKPRLNIADYVKNKYVKLYDFTFTIQNGEGYYTRKGVEFSPAELDAAYPTPHILTRDIFDGRKAWMK